MKEENVFMCRELIVMIGITASGKSFHINKSYIKDHQYISENHIIEGMRGENIPIDENIKNMIIAITARSHMIRGLPIVVDEPNLEIESLFIWRKLAVEHKYSIKGIIIDTPIEICADRLQSLLKTKSDEKTIYETLDLEDEKLQELKIILLMKHQNILDEVEIITHGG